jgi:CHAT domain-containing protein/Tfp pilus assembly protein PilF
MQKIGLGRVFSCSAIAFAISFAFIVGSAKQCVAQEFQAKYKHFASLQRNNWQAAPPVGEELFEMAADSYGPYHLNTARVALELGALYRDLGKYKKAESLLGRAYRTRKKHVSEDDISVAEVLFHRGTLHEIIRKYEKANDDLLKSLAIYEKSIGKGSVDSAPVLSQLAMAVLGNGELSDSLQLAERAVQILRDAKNAKPTSLGQSLTILGFIYQRVGRYQQAEETLQEALDLLRGEFGNEHPYVAQVLYDLATVYLMRGQYDRARQLYESALTYRQKHLGKEHLHVAFVINNIGLIHLRRQELKEALSMFERSVEIKRKSLGDDSLEVAKGLVNVGNVYFDLGQLDKAEQHYITALQMKIEKLGQNHPSVADTLNNLGNIFNRTNRQSAAEKYYQQSLAISEKMLGVAHPKTNITRSNLAAYYLKLGQASKAEKLLEQSLTVAKGKFGESHPRVASILRLLANYYKQQKEIGRAIVTYQRAIEVTEKAFGSEHPDVATGLGALAIAYAENNRPELAMATADRARRISRRYIAEVLPSMPEMEQLDFLQATDNFQFHNALSIGMRYAQDIQSGETVAEWVLNGKSVSLEALAANIARLRDSEHPEVVKLSKELAAVRTKLSALFSKAPSEGRLSEHNRLIVNTRKRQRELLEQLEKLTGRHSTKDAWVRLQDIRAAIPKGSVLVEFARFPEARFGAITSFKGRKWTPRYLTYAAWIIPRLDEGPIRVVRLGSAERIDALILKARRSIFTSLASLKEKGEKAAENEVSKQLADLSKEILAPIEFTLRDSDKWILCPDANLWFVPWAALVLSDGSYLVEKHSLSYVVTGRDVRGTWASKERQKPLIVANPAYDLGVPRTSERPKDFSALPGTAKEAEAIAGSVEKAFNSKPIIYTERKATETLIKDAKSPSALVLCTHGYFIPAPRYARMNPLLRCGLAFAGANRAGSIHRSNDGVLTGLEVIGLDLTGTDLVVLSACDTGVGESTDGEGVAGLRQAFQFAGARTVVSTLWSIPDMETADLSRALFEQLSKVHDAADSLRAAQVEIIKTRREQHGGAHPIYWAAFTVTTKHLDDSSSSADNPNETHPRQVERRDSHLADSERPPELKHVLEGHRQEVSSVCFGPNGRLMATTSRDAKIRIWDLVNEQAILTKPGRFQGAAEVQFASDGRHVASENDDQIIYFNVETGDLVNSIRKPNDTIQIEFSQNADVVAASTKSAIVKVWRPASGELIGEFKGITNPKHVHTNDRGNKKIVLRPRDDIRFRLSPDGRKLALEELGGFGIWDTTSGKKLWSVTADYQATLVFNRASTLLFVKSYDRAKKQVSSILWEANSGQRQTAVPIDRRARNWHFGPADRLLTVQDFNDELIICADSGKTELARISSTRQTRDKVAYSDDGRLVATRDGGTVNVWDFQTLKQQSSSVNAGVLPNADALLLPNAPLAKSKRPVSKQPGYNSSNDTILIVIGISAIVLMIAFLGYRGYKSIKE